MRPDYHLDISQFLLKQDVFFGHFNTIWVDLLTSSLYSQPTHTGRWLLRTEARRTLGSTSTSNRFAHEDLADWVYPGKYLPFYPLFSNFFKGNIGIYPTMIHDQVSLYLNSIGEYMNIGRIWMNSGYFLWTRGRDRAIWRPSSSSFLKIPYRRASPRMEMAEWFPLVFLASFITPKQVSWVGFEHFCGIQHRHLTWIHLCLDPTVNTSDIPVRGKAVGCIFQHSDFLCGYISAYFSMRIVCWYCCSFSRCRPKFDYYYTSYIIYIYIYIYRYIFYLLLWPLSVLGAKASRLINQIKKVFLCPRCLFPHTRFPSLARQHVGMLWMHISHTRTHEYCHIFHPSWNFLYRIRNVKSWKMVRFNPLLCLGVPTQCQRFQFYRGPWGLWFYRDFMLNTALSTSQQRVLGTAIL